jgi:hypothetical protein
MSDSAKMDEVLARMLEPLSALQRTVEELANKVGALESRHSRPSVTFERRSSGAAAAAVSKDDGQGSAEEFVDGGQFDFVQGQDFNGRRSSAFSQSGAKDVGTKLERPKFVVKKTQTSNGFKTEWVEDSDYLDYLDDYDHYFAQWKTIPANEGLSYSNEERVPIVNLPPRYARRIANRLKWIYDKTELLFCSQRQIQSANFWKDMTSAKLREEIGKLVERDLSYKGASDLLRKITFRSGFGPIDMKAFAVYQHDFKQELIRLRAGNRMPNPTTLKDIIIASYPDRMYQQELVAKFGPHGVLNGDPEEFAINLVFEDIETHIAEITKQGLRAVVNNHLRDTRNHDASNHSPRTPSFGNPKFISHEAKPGAPRTPSFGHPKFEGKVHQTVLSDLFGESDDDFWKPETGQNQGASFEDEQPIHNSSEHPEDDSHQSSERDQEQWQILVNSTVLNKQKCLRPGKGPDGLLLCKFLGGAGASCTFEHPEDDHKFKGKGFSTSTPFKKY